MKGIRSLTMLALAAFASAQTIDSLDPCGVSPGLASGASIGFLLPPWPLSEFEALVGMHMLTAC